MRRVSRRCSSQRCQGRSLLPQRRGHSWGPRHSGPCDRARDLFAAKEHQTVKTQMHEVMGGCDGLQILDGTDTVETCSELSACDVVGGILDEAVDDYSYESVEVKDLETTHTVEVVELEPPSVEAQDDVSVVSRGTHLERLVDEIAWMAVEDILWSAPTQAPDRAACRPNNEMPVDIEACDDSFGELLRDTSQSRCSHAPLRPRLCPKVNALPSEPFPMDCLPSDPVTEPPCAHVFTMEAAERLNACLRQSLGQTKEFADSRCVSAAAVPPPVAPCPARARRRHRAQTTATVSDRHGEPQTPLSEVVSVCRPWSPPRRLHALNLQAHCQDLTTRAVASCSSRAPAAPDASETSVPIAVTVGNRVHCAGSQPIKLAPRPPTFAQGVRRTKRSGAKKPTTFRMDDSEPSTPEPRRTSSLTQRYRALGAEVFNLDGTQPSPRNSFHWADSPGSQRSKMQHSGQRSLSTEVSSPKKSAMELDLGFPRVSRGEVDTCNKRSKAPFLPSLPGRSDVAWNVTSTPRNARLLF